MRVLSVNVGQPKPVPARGQTVLTSIFKEPVAGPVAVEQRNLAGDRQADLTVHGGSDKAVYAYPHEHYGTWSEQLSRDDFQYGQFGENLTTVGLIESEVLMGEQFRIGTAVLEASQPRMPCFKLGIRMGDPRFVKTFFRSGLCGIYFRVIETGTLCAEDAIEAIARPSSSMTVAEVYAIGLGFEPDPEKRQLALDNPYLATAWKSAIHEFSKG